jgi:ribosome maturation factor RimP
MPMPTQERVSQLVAGLVERRGFDLEGVVIAAAGRGQAQVKVVVDSDSAIDLDAIAELSTDVSQALDDAGDFGETSYLLEVTTPGIDRPLTVPRHWRRARGRKARVTLRPGAPTPAGVTTFDARVGACTDAEVALVLGGMRGPRSVTVPLADIGKAVVQVEFSPPGAAEMALAGGVVPGRPEPGASDTAEEPEVAGPALASPREDTDEEVPHSVAASTEGIVE